MPPRHRPLRSDSLRARSLPLRLSHDFLLLYDAQIEKIRGRLKEFQKKCVFFGKLGKMSTHFREKRNKLESKNIEN